MILASLQPSASGAKDEEKDPSAGKYNRKKSVPTSDPRTPKGEETPAQRAKTEEHDTA